MQKAEGTPESPICAVTQRQLSYLHSGNQDGLHPVCPKLSLLKTKKPLLPSECPDFQKRKIEGVSVLRRGCWGHLQRVKRGGGSGQLEPHQTLPATLSSQNSSSLWLQSHSSSLHQALPSAGLWEAWTTPALLLGLFLAETLERSRHSHCFSNNVVTKEQLDKSSGGTELSSDPSRKETCKNCLRFQGHHSPNCHHQSLGNLCAFSRAVTSLFGGVVLAFEKVCFRYSYSHPPKE